MKSAVFIFSVIVLVVQSKSAPRTSNDVLETDIDSLLNLTKRITDPCALNPCQNGGACVGIENKFKCICKSPYFGDTCSKDPCTPNPCHNGGKCKHDREGFRCDCKYPFRGETCNLDFCSPNPCVNDGRCELIGNSFNCTCKNPYHGETCELGPCSPNPCKKSGECEEDGESFKCTCKSPFHGKICEKSPCEPNPCENNGTCYLTSDNNYICRCKEAFSGERCEKGPCSPNPCLNNGECKVDGKAFSCQCDPPYEGKHCEKGPCSSNPCLNNGGCRVVDLTFRCDCNPPYKGDQCELRDVTEPDTSVPTFSNSITTISITHENITELTNSYNWISSETSVFTSEENVTTTTDQNSTSDIVSTTLEKGNHNASPKGHCETDNDCLNGGTCRRGKEEEHTCDCTENFGGMRCEVNLPCIGLEQSCGMMNAVCVIVDNHAICECPNGTLYHRKSGLCEDICDPRKCLHGKCEIIGKTYKCNCDQGYTGSHCDEKERSSHENFVPWFTVIASLNLFLCVLLIGMFCIICEIKRFIKSS